jgi:hypothetical protein
MRFDLVGSGGLYTTVEDLFLWDQNFYNNKLGEVGEALIEKMHTNGKLSNGEEVNYAFALVNGNYRGLRTVSHGGALGGYRAQLVRFPKQHFSVAILSNLAGFNPTALAYKVADIYLAEHLTAEAATAETIDRARAVERTAVTVDPAVYDAYVGRYARESGQVIAIVKENGKLILAWPGLPKIELLPASQTRFFQNYDEDELSFHVDDSSKAFYLVIHRGNREIRYDRVLEVTRDGFREYTGNYYSDELDVAYKLFIEDGQFFVKVGNTRKIQSDIIKKDVLVCRGNKAIVERNAFGNIVGFRLDAGRVRNLKFVRK